MNRRDEIEKIIAEHWVEKWDDRMHPSAVRCMKDGCGWEGSFPGEIAGHNADLIMATLGPSDGVD